MSEGSLWGDLSTLKTIRTPKTILAEQAEILNQATKGLIRAEIMSSQGGENLTYSLTIIAPILNNYRYLVCNVQHDINIYPCKIFSNATGIWEACPNEQTLMVKLAAILGGDKTRLVIESLLSQSKV
jgi:hypothetical protein